MKITDIQKLKALKIQIDGQAVPGLDSFGIIVDFERYSQPTVYFYERGVSTVKDLDDFLALKAFHNSITMTNFTKPSWLIDLEIAPQTEIAKYTEKNYEIEDCTWLNLYFRFISACKYIRENPEERAVIFIAHNDDGDWTDLWIFTTQEEIDNFFNEYYLEEEQ